MESWVGPVYLVICFLLGGPVPYLELFGGGPVKRNTLYMHASGLWVKDHRHVHQTFVHGGYMHPVNMYHGFMHPEYIHRGYMHHGFMHRRHSGGQGGSHSLTIT